MKVLKILFTFILLFLISLLTPGVALADCETVHCESAGHSEGCVDWGTGKYCWCDDCPCAGCYGYVCDCQPCESPPCGGGCFTGETEISVGQEGERAGEQEGETKQIKDLKPGDVVESFSPETGEIKERTVSDITKTTREGYYILETESGKKVKVTAEHPFLAIKANNSKLKTENSKLIDNLKEILSHTLTYRLITSLQAKMGEVLK